MKSARTFVSVLALVGAVVGGAVVPAFAGLMHPVCTARHHDCGQIPRIAKCCCGDEQTSQTDSTPVQSRVEVRADMSPMAAVTNVVLVAIPPQQRITAVTSPPHLALQDRPTLFSSLLI